MFINEYGRTNQAGRLHLGLVAVIGAANPYGTIIRRNIFDLASPKEDISKPGDVFKPPPDIRISGVAAFGSQKWVLLTVDPGKGPRHLLMREGEKEASLEIVTVDEQLAVVKVRADGELLELSLPRSGL